MPGLILEPHCDDVALFAAYTALREQPKVITVLRSVAQEALYGVTSLERGAENQKALMMLGVDSWESWPYPDDDPPWAIIADRFAVLKMKSLVDHVWAPRPGPGWVDHHHRIGDLALKTFGPNRVTFYTTYTSLAARDRAGIEVPIEKKEWVGKKLQALACYQSQMKTPSYIHFIEDMREYVVHPS